MKYLDFELEVQPGSGPEYPVAVVRSPAGEARSVMQFPFDRLALENQLLKLQNALLRSGGKWRSALSPEEQGVQTFGASLFDALFTGDVRTRYAVSRERAERDGLGLRVKLRILDPRLAALPWEFLYDAEQAEYLCLSRNSPVVRYLDLAQGVPSLEVTPPLCILGMIASPRDQKSLDIEREKTRVERAVAGLVQRGLVELTWLAGESWRELQAAMQGGPWHVFHFIGHGAYDRDRDEGVVVLSAEDGLSEYLGATQLARLLADQRSLRLVLLNACEGARSGETDIFSSTASILVRRGIPAVLAMQYAITDDAAIETSRSFYGALARGLPVDAAVSEARKAVSLAVPNTIEWGTPVLYMRTPDGLLFNLQPTTRDAATSNAGDRSPAGESSSPVDEAQPPQPQMPRKKEIETPAQAEVLGQADAAVEPAIQQLQEAKEETERTVGGGAGTQSSAKEADPASHRSEVMPARSSQAALEASLVKTRSWDLPAPATEAVAVTAAARGRPWWLTLILGSALFLAGVYLLTPGYGLNDSLRMALDLFRLFGAYFLAWGILELVYASLDRSAWGWKVSMGLVSVVIGGAVLNDATYGGQVNAGSIWWWASQLVLILWAVIVGIVLLYQASKGGGWGAGLPGAVSLFFGLILVANGIEFRDTWFWLEMVSTMVIGVVMVVWSIRRRNA